MFGFRNKNANVPVTILRARAILTNHGLRRCPWHVHAWRGRGGRGNKIRTSHSVKRNHGQEPTGRNSQTSVGYNRDIWKYPLLNSIVLVQNLPSISVTFGRYVVMRCHTQTDWTKSNRLSWVVVRLNCSSATRSGKTWTLQNAEQDEQHAVHSANVLWTWTDGDRDEMYQILCRWTAFKHRVKRNRSGGTGMECSLRITVGVWDVPSRRAVIVMKPLICLYHIYTYTLCEVALLILKYSRNDSEHSKSTKAHCPLWASHTWCELCTSADKVNFGLLSALSRPICA